MVKSDKSYPTIPYEELEFGFKYGSAEVTRLCSNDKQGWVIISVDTPKQAIQVYVTKTGKVRIYNNSAEISLTPKTR